MDTGLTTRKDGWSGHMENVFAGTFCLFGFSCEYSPSPSPHSNLCPCHTRCTRPIHDIRVDIQDGIKDADSLPKHQQALWDYNTGHVTVHYYYIQIHR